MKDLFLEILYETTLNGQTQWKSHNSLFSDDMRHYYTCEPDSKTHVRIEINLKVISNIIDYDCCGYIRVENQDFTKKFLHFTKYDSPIIEKIGKLIYEKNIKPNLKPIIKTDDDILKDIINNMPSKQVVRDNKIKNILGN